MPASERKLLSHSGQPKGVGFGEVATVGHDASDVLPLFSRLTSPPTWFWLESVAVKGIGVSLSCPPGVAGFGPTPSMTDGGRVTSYDLLVQLKST